MRILVCAYACNPYHGSEHAVGWGFISGLAKEHVVHVIAETEKCRADIIRYCAENGSAVANLHFHFIEKRRARVLRKMWPPSYYWFYRQWQRRAYQLALELHSREQFDVIHQLTMVGFREPGYLWKINAPFVWGPIGGMGGVPWRILPRLGFKGFAYYVAYNLINSLQELFLLRPRLAAKRAGIGLLAATPENQAATLRRWNQASVLLPEVGLPRRQATSPAFRLPGEPLKILWIGQHTPGKALNLGLEALARLPRHLEWELRILGSGTQTQRWKRIARELGVEDRCSFVGWLPRDDVLSIISESHVGLITTVRDLTSTVTIEYLSQGVPVVCFDHSGVGAAIDQTCGIKVTLTGPADSIMALAAALETMFQEPTRDSLARGALIRANEYSWPRKVEFIEEIYRKRIAGIR